MPSDILTHDVFQDTRDVKTKTLKLPNKKTPAVISPPKPTKEKAVKPKKENIKPGKAGKPEPTVRTKVVGHQPGVVKSMTYYKASITDEEEHGGGETLQFGFNTLFTFQAKRGVHKMLPTVS